MVGARSPSPLLSRECGRRAWSRRDPASPLLRRALSPDRLHPRSADKSRLCCSPRPRVWRSPAPPAPTTPPTAADLPRIAEEHSPTHRTPSKQITPNIFTSSPKASSLDKLKLDMSFDSKDVSFASLSLSDESFAFGDSSCDVTDVSKIDKTQDISLSKLRSEDSRSSNDPTTLQEDKSVKQEPIQPSLIPKLCKKEGFKEEEKKEQKKPVLKKQDSIKKEPEEKLAKAEKSEKLERTGSVKFNESFREKKQEKEREKAEKKEKSELKKTDSVRKLELKKQDSVDALKSPEGEVEGRRPSMVSKLLGVMGRKHDTDRTNKKTDKHNKKKGGNSSHLQKQDSQCEKGIEREADDKKTKKGRGRASSSSSGEK